MTDREWSYLSIQIPDIFRMIIHPKYTEIRAIPEILCDRDTRLFAGIFSSAAIYSLIHANYARSQSRATFEDNIVRGYRQFG